MDLNVFWHKPVKLVDGSDQRLIYKCPSLDRIHPGPGVYVFGRRFGDGIEPRYIGQAKNVRQRIHQHLNGNVRLMTALRDAKIGSRVVLVGELRTKPGQQAAKVLRLIEAALIKYALAEGHEIVNSLGTKTPHHELSMEGNRLAVGLFRSSMKLER